MTWLLVLVGGAVGAPVRYLVDRAVAMRTRSVFPLGTLMVNVVGCFVLGCLVGVARSTYGCCWAPASAVP